MGANRAPKRRISGLKTVRAASGKPAAQTTEELSMPPMVPIMGMTVPVAMGSISVEIDQFPPAGTRNQQGTPIKPLFWTV